MSAARTDTGPWVATCDVCDCTAEFSSELDVPALGEAAREAGWTIPVYGGMFCARCSTAIKGLSDKWRARHP